MGDPITLGYHRAVCDLLGIPPILSPPAIRLLEQRERACGITLPPSVREWYSLDGAVDLLVKYSNDDHPVRLEELGDPAEVAQGYLCVEVENQAVVGWFVRLDGSDDPPVYDNNDQWWAEDLSQVDWHLVSPAFSHFVFDQIAHYFVGGWWNNARLPALDRPPTPEDLAYLGRAYRIGPITDDGGGTGRYRLFNKFGLIYIVTFRDESTGELRAEWSIEGHSQEALCELARSVWHLGTLAERLKPESCYVKQSCGWAVLERLRGGSGSSGTQGAKPRPKESLADPSLSSGVWDRELDDRRGGDTAQGPKDRGMPQSIFHARYLAGEYEPVWRDLMGLGDALRSGPHRCDAWAVACETMRRARTNIESIYGRLLGIGYAFADPERACPTPGPDTPEKVARFEVAVGPLPLSLRAFFEVVGSVNFMQDRSRSTSGEVYALGELDPLVVRSIDDLLAQWEREMDRGRSPVLRLLRPFVRRRRRKVERVIYDFAPDEIHKAGYGGVGPFYLVLPDGRADGPVLFEGAEIGETFVEYLRQTIRCGGFREIDRLRDEFPRTDLPDRLADGLIAI